MKNVYALLIAVSLCVFSINTVFASNTVSSSASGSNIDFIIDKDLNSYTLNTVPTTGTLPLIRTGTANAHKINAEIERIRYDVASEAKKNKALSTDFSYEIMTGGLDNEYISIVIYSTTTMASAFERIDTIVLLSSTHEILNLNDILGNNGVKIANNVISDKLASTIGAYSNTSVTINETHDFYINNNILYLAFDKYEIASGSAGIQTIEINLENVINLVLTETEFQLSGLYGIRMIPLRHVCETFGYQISSWIQSTQTASITKEGSSYPIIVEIGKNEYKRSGSRTEIAYTLEAAPEIINNSIYVPVTFTDVILDLNYSIDSSGNITISDYKY